MPDGKEIVRRIFDEIVNEGRLDVVDELFAEDFVDHGPMGDVQGREAFKALMGQWRSAVPDGIGARVQSDGWPHVPPAEVARQRLRARQTSSLGQRRAHAAVM